MSNRRGIVLEIAGIDVAYATTPNAPTLWASSVRECVVSVPNGSLVSVDFNTMHANTGGTSLNAIDLYPELLHFSDGPICTVDGEHGKSDDTISVNSTTGFPLAGIFWHGKEAVRYTGLSGTSFTGCAPGRGALGTIAQPIEANATIYSYSPNLLGRKCILRWYDLDDPTLTTTRYTGYIDSLDFGSSGYTLAIISSKQTFEDSVALKSTQGKGRVEVDAQSIKVLEISFDGEEQEKFLTDLDYDHWPRRYIRIDDELIEYSPSNVRYPAYQTTVASVTSGYEVELTKGAGFGRGRIVEFMSGGVVAATATILARTSSTTIKHNGNYSPTIGDTVRVAGVASVVGAKRGALFTREDEHDDGAEISEYRVLEGNQCDILLWLILSRYGDKSNSNYDILPRGWGAGIDSSLVDILSFERLLKPRCTRRQYVMQEESKITDFIAVVAKATNTRIYWGTDGLLTCKPVHDIFPLDQADFELDRDLLVAGEIPSLRVDKSLIRNVWEWPSDHDIDGDPRAMMRVVIEESRRLYGELPMPQMEDKGMRASEHNGISYAIARAALSQRAVPVSILSCSIEFADDQEYFPGDLANVNVPHLPNMAGGEGLTDEIFEVTSYTPQESNGTAQLTLLRRRNPKDLGHISPVCMVESVAGDLITLRPASYTKYAQSNGPFRPPGNESFDGSEDVHWFLEGDNVRVWDVSTFGTSATNAFAIITEINYITRQIRLNSKPPWLAAGDLIRLDNWQTVKVGGRAPHRVGIFIFLADDTTALLNTDNPYRWGI
jgi:hypothetical protein